MSPRRLFLAVMILALAVMPVRMAAAHDVVMEQAPAASGHCGGSDRAPADRSAPHVDCMTACAAIAETGACDLAPPMAYSAAAAFAAPVDHHRGLGPEAATPPPRIS